MHLDPAHLLSFERLSSLYREPSAAVKAKIIDRIGPDLARIIAQSPLVVLATSGPDGLDCSPRGDVGQVVYVEDQ